ncbi:MAG: DNA-3-methyladenine glycosylase I [Myxococcales bacterium]|nr:DNA-3-methyladenine glycosylase I [Myxococcales bacterium]
MTRLAEGLVRGDDGVVRCWWGAQPEIYQRYHDTEWGFPVTDDTRLFEKLCLEGFQSGLSWLTILNKRDNFRKAFKGFDFAKVARFEQRDVERLLGDAGIVRHRGKIESTINNARRTLELVKEHGSLLSFVRDHAPHPRTRPRRCTKRALLELSKTPESVALSKALKQRGFTFVGPTTVYAFMQAMGLVNDHVEGCPARARVEAARAALA